MSETNREFPYKPLGNRLKHAREKLQESLAEASGAVEIELDELNRIEQGKSRPSEDILLLLISHFALKEDEATNLWELAEYDKQDLPVVNMTSGQDGETTIMAASSDIRINYTDMVHVMVNKYGVVLNFMQSGGPNGQPLMISRVGMSKEHASNVLETLQKTLDVTVTKALPAPKVKKSSQKKSK